MASGTLDADKIRKDKSKWGEFNKVYTRRRKQLVNNAAASPIAGSPFTTGNNEQTLENPDADNEKTLGNEDPDPYGQSQRDEPVVDVGNGVARPIATVVDDRVRICLEASTSKSEIKELREKLILELGQVRGLVQKLEYKEAEITHYSDVRDLTDIDEGYAQLQYHPGNLAVDGNGRSLLRVNSEMGTDYMDRRGLTSVHSEVGSDIIDRRALTRVHSEMSPFVTQDMSRFRQLSVSVGEYVEKEKRTPKANQYYRNSDFLLSKDRLPPESNKKLKSNGGRKSDYSSSFERHRNQVFRSCSNLLQRLMKHKHGWVFNEPVNAKLLGLHDYHDIIKHPMDLGTIRSRLAQNFYKTPGEFADDVRLTFHNAMTYNPRGQDVHVMAEQLSDIFEERWVVIESDWNYGPVHETPISRKVNNPRTLDRSQSMGLPFMARPKPPSFAPVRTPAPKKPKAKDPNKRDMTIEEKQKLSANLQSLPSEKLDSIVQIINKSNTSLSQNDDEIEVDIDSVDAETLWELDRFVTNYKKNLSKHKRKAEKARALAENNNQAMLQNPVASIPEVLPEKRAADEQNPAASQPNQGGDNMSSSSSSSSDSGSSSSDSDSDSSSAGGSDAGR
ncbi:transcription factor GTE4-like isoform X2 [Bidens hawaiensis]|uniref:transcription factor GTE4-like isoform X2 n=1 Tax=Bidens hawaiensis TaxID=980011 RepID=UPI0040492A10